jgi:hypothetical protein
MGRPLMPRARSLPPPQTERQLALPLEATVAPAVLVPVGPRIPLGRVWTSLGPHAQTAVQQAIQRICVEVIHDAAADR